MIWLCYDDQLLAGHLCPSSPCSILPRPLRAVNVGLYWLRKSPPFPRLFSRLPLLPMSDARTQILAQKYKITFKLNNIDNIKNYLK